MRSVMILTDRFLSLQFNRPGDYTIAKRTLITCLHRMNELEVADRIYESTQDIADTGLTLEEIETVYWGLLQNHGMTVTIQVGKSQLPLTYLKRLLDAFAQDSLNVIADIVDSLNQNIPLGIQDPLLKLRQEEEETRRYLAQFEQNK